ncbi:hypothetical protein [Roseibium sp. M-1]
MTYHNSSLVDVAAFEHLNVKTGCLSYAPFNLERIEGLLLEKGFAWLNVRNEGAIPPVGGIHK